ncbi:MAG: ABC transporter permease [Candidatus Omnitrophica bacterium]|nr:ABC transporter permease [Candidatus Omnitrophota bacterium]
MVSRVTAPVLLAGAWVVALCEYTGHLALLLVQAVGGCFVRPIRAKAVIYELWKIGAQSWLIVSLSLLFVGMVLAFQSAYQMQKLAAQVYIASLVSLSVVREIGPVMTALIVAGRVGSAIAAELGTMKVTEQMDALVTLATDPVRWLVVPRLLASLLALPLLTVWADVVGIGGGFVIALR